MIESIFSWEFVWVCWYYIIALLIIFLIRSYMLHESPHSLKIWHDTSAKNVILEKLTVNNREVFNAIGYRLDKKDWNSMQVESPEIKISSSSQNISIQFNLSVDGKLDRHNVKFKLKDNIVRYE